MNTKQLALFRRLAQINGMIPLDEAKKPTEVKCDNCGRDYLVTPQGEPKKCPKCGDSARSDRPKS